MTILTEQLPELVEIDGLEVPINIDFRAALRVIMAYEDPDLTVFERQAIMLENLYPERPGNLGEALRLGMAFLNGGMTGEGANGPRVYSFEKDAALIFAAFRQTHGIDLETAELHWWKFLALFMDLGADTTFCNLVTLRRRVKTGKASKEERAIASELGEAFDIPEPDTRTIDEKIREAEFLRLVAEGQRQREEARSQS